MRDELRRAMEGLAKSDPAPFFVSSSAYDRESVELASFLGSIMRSDTNRSRMVDILARVGDVGLGSSQGMPLSGLASDTLPLADDSQAIARILWRTTHAAYRRAATNYLRAKAQAVVRPESEDKSPSFSSESPHTHTGGAAPALVYDARLWEDRLRRYSAEFRKYPELLTSGVQFEIERTMFTFVSSEGTALTQPSRLARLIIHAAALAEDGTELARGDVLQSETDRDLPAEKDVFARIDKIAADLKALRTAPVAEPFVGPALMSGEAAAVFFHEVLGHRLEGNRQRDDTEGQTFTRKVNERVLPEFLSLVSDPNLKEINGTILSGAYGFDQEGVPGSRVDLIVDGTLKNFLMSRMPITNFRNSNGHGRAQPGRMVVARQSNLIVKSTKTTNDAELRRKLVEEAKRQGKPFGLYFENMLGGFTITQRGMPQSFQLLPVMVWRVPVDGGKDELIRDVDIVGTPLAALQNILMTGDRLSVFNGMCGAESGQVPVSAVSPSILFSSVEIQKRAQDRVRPPILTAPDAGEVRQ
jgi:TldD protein